MLDIVSLHFLKYVVCVCVCVCVTVCELTVHSLHFLKYVLCVCVCVCVCVCERERERERETFCELTVHLSSHDWFSFYCTDRCFCFHILSIMLMVVGI